MAEKGLKEKWVKRLVLFLLVLPVALYFSLVALAYFSQDKIVQTVLSVLNEDFRGTLTIEDSHISPFANFPYISIDLEDVRLFEGKKTDTLPLVEINDTYIGFSLWDILQGNYSIKTIKIQGGHIDVVQHTDGSFNILNAVSSRAEANESEALYYDLQAIVIENLKLSKLNEENRVFITSNLSEARINLKTKKNHLYLGLDAALKVSILKDERPTFFTNKQVKLHTTFDWVEDQQLITLLPSELRLEKAKFGVEGTIDLDDDGLMDLHFRGDKPNFDLFMAFAPEALAPTLQRYDNTGKILFEAHVKGKTLNGRTPAVEVNFACENAVFSNITARKQLNNLNFKARLIKEADGGKESMKFHLTDFTADPEAGYFKGDLKIENFDSPDIHLQLDSDFELDFLAKFLNYKDLQDLRGRVQLVMNFRDIIDLGNPEKSIERLNESYYTRLTVTDLGFKSPDFHLPLENINLVAVMDGHKANISRFDMKAGKSVLSAKGYVSDLPALLHQNNDPILLHLDMRSDYMDMAGLNNRRDDTTFIKDLSFSLDLKSSAKALIDFFDKEKSIERNHANYHSSIRLKNLSFVSNAFHLPVTIRDASFEIHGCKAMIDNIYLKAGQSDLQIRGSVSDLPGILHHTSHVVKTDLTFITRRINLSELMPAAGSSRDQSDRFIEDARARIGFVSSAKSLTESPNLPVGEFFVYDLFGKVSGYPHELHDFRADIIITDNDFQVIDFSGMLDSSDFHFNGKLYNYPLFLKDSLRGDVVLKYDLKSRFLKLRDLFTYEGENHVPEDYRHEELRNLNLKGKAALHFNEMGLHSSDVHVEDLDAKLLVHPLALYDFKGRFHIEDEHVVTEKFSGGLGESSFLLDLNYYYGKDPKIRKRDNYLSFRSPRLNFDEVFNYNPIPVKEVQAPKVNHDDVFSVFDLPFPEMRFHFSIDHLNYRKYLIKNFKAKIRTHPDHTAHVDAFSFDAAGGSVQLKGYFNGTDRKKIYTRPELTLSNVDLDQLLFKFDNFGQDHLVSENLHGSLSGTISGKIYLHADLTPIVDQSDLQLDISVQNGMIENFGPLYALSDYFKDKNLNKVRFGELKNQFTYHKGVMQVPRMTINTSLGFLEISGKQDLEMNMEYFVRVPWKMLTSVGFSRLFGGKKEEELDPESLDDIQYRDEDKRIRFINLKITGNSEDFKVSLGKERN